MDQCSCKTGKSEVFTDYADYTDNEVNLMPFRFGPNNQRLPGHLSAVTPFLSF
jgi:hypothetical protein